MINILALMTFILMLCWLFDIFRKFYNEYHYKWKHYKNDGTLLDNFIFKILGFK